MSGGLRRKGKKLYNGCVSADTLAEVHALISQIEDSGSEVHLERTGGKTI